MKYEHRSTGAIYEGRGRDGAGVIWHNSWGEWRSVWTNTRTPTKVLDQNIKPIIDIKDDIEPLKQELQAASHNLHELALPLAQNLLWNLGNVVIAVSRGDLAGAQAALSAEFARRYGVSEPEGGHHVEADETRA